ncbi:glycosyltransferase family 4 protein [Fibrobacter sp.]|uniref:glycosyltransferase family 4 protein n=1 Tax=Fibrobacter sp. TaxID=35828 RepID=UPI00386862B3
MKRILIVATTSYAGMGPYVASIVNNFTIDDDVHYFFLDYEDDYYRKNVKIELHEKSLFFKYPNSPLNKLKWLLTNDYPYDGAILRLCQEKHIRLVHYINGFPSKKMAKKFSALGIEVLGTVHDLKMHEQNKSFYKMWFRNISWKRLLNSFDACPYLVTNSRSQYEEIKTKHPRKEISYHSFPSLVTSEIASGNDVPVELMNLDKPYILFFGRIEEYKGLNLLVDAFLSCETINSEYYLVIAGSGELKSKSVLSSRIVMLNRYIKDSEIACLYKNASAVVYPYISATQSGVLTLAFFFGTPVLASDVPFFKDSIENDDVGLLFRSGNVEDLVVKLKIILKKNRNTMSVAQKELYYKNYDGNAIREKLLEIYSHEN